MTNAIFAWVAIANALSFAVYGIDKARARRGSTRIPEARLALVAAAGGAPAAYLACSFFRHKTRKRSFQVKLALASLVCAGLYYLAWTQIAGS